MAFFRELWLFVITSMSGSRAVVKTPCHLQSVACRSKLFREHSDISDWFVLDQISRWAAEQFHPATWPISLMLAALLLSEEDELICPIH
jgi:hypothetical protein